MLKIDSRIVLYVDGYIKEHGYSPSVREIRDDLDLGSLDTLHRRLRHLKRRGILDWKERQARTLRVIDTSEAKETSTSNRRSMYD